MYRFTYRYSVYHVVFTDQRHRRPTASETKAQSAVMLTFVLALSVGIAISVLLGWHIYLILTAQTTIEFYQNQTNRSRARQWGEVSETTPRTENDLTGCAIIDVNGNILCLHHSEVLYVPTTCWACAAVLQTGTMSLNT